MQFGRVRILSDRGNCVLYSTMDSLDYRMCGTGYGCFIHGALTPIHRIGMWCGACIGCLLLVTYRIFELMNMSKRFEVRKKSIIKINRKFVGHFQSRTNTLIVFASCYALYFAFLTPPILMNSEHNAMFYDPFIGDVPTQVVE